MRFLSLLVVLLCLLCVGCSDDTETLKDGGADVAVVEAGTDAIVDITPGDAPADPDAAMDSGGDSQDSVLPDTATEGGVDQ